MTDWHTWGKAEVLQRLGADPGRGLSEPEVRRRLAENGPNELVERDRRRPWVILWEQLTSTLVVVLIVAAVVSGFLGDFQDAVAISIIVVLNALLGFHQEYRAERAMAALKKLAAPNVTVRRGGHVEEISGRGLVPGDVVLLDAGNLVPADCRVLESANLRMQEAALTGESEPVDKDPEALGAADTPLGDRRNMAYMGAVVTYGHGVGVIVETGMRTQLGSIAAILQTVDREATPLQRRLDQLGRGLAGVALVLVAVIFTLGLLRGEEMKLMFLTAVSLAVAAVPEGLPAVVTIALALGTQRMFKRNALVRKLPAVETLGSVTVICSDKTGTLTENRMTVAVLDVAGHQLNLTEHLRRETMALDDRVGPSSLLGEHSALALLLVGGALCNDAILEAHPGGSGRFRALGDPTEAALVLAAAHFGLRKEDLEKGFPRVAELPFDSERKRMSTVHAFPSPSHVPDVLQFAWERVADTMPAPHVAFAKGAVESLLQVCSDVWVEHRIEPLAETWLRQIDASHDRLAQGGMRVIGVAFRPVQRWAEDRKHALETDLVFVGMIGMLDPPRPEVKDAVQICRSAGIRPVMITGDHALTARRIARELGIATDGAVLTGAELTPLSVPQLQELVEEVNVYARVSPEHKLKIVEALQKRGQIVAMTGDGVNDAPALKKADIGIAMGVTGTDVSKEAADMVLLDDNFATIVAAVAEGRVIYDNIRKFIKYLMTTNSGELWVMLAGPFVGMPLPLLPLQILWINLVTDGLPALALSLEPPERDVMRRAPYHPGESIFGRGMGPHILCVGLLMGLVSLGVGSWYWYRAAAHWQTMLFSTLALSQMGHVLAIRSGRDSLFSIGLLSNKPLLATVVLTFALQLGLVYIPFCQQFFHTETLPGRDLAISLVSSTMVFWAVELEKLWIRSHTGGNRQKSGQDA